MPLVVTLALTKAAARLSRLAGRGGGHALPGLLAERLDPHLAAKLATDLPHGCIVVTGTNGKTTTTKLILAALEASGERVLTNRTGSNLKRGVVSALIAAADMHGRLDATIGLFEVDEASLRLVTPLIKPRHIVVLNLFRDQLDRYGELDTTAAMIGEGIAASQAKLYLNADDPLVASLAKYALSAEVVTYFGIEGLPSGATGAHATAADSDRCPVCSRRLSFSRVFYGHIGHYRCPEGHFNRPQPAIALTSVERADKSGTHFTVAIQSKRLTASLALPGVYNLYNGLAAMAVAHGLGLDMPAALTAIGQATAAFGRVETIEIQGRTLYLLLIKNPAGFTQVLETFLVGAQGARILMAINDNPADGRDVSWLWDVPIEALAEAEPTVLTTGIRSADMALRLKYAGLEARPYDDLAVALRELVEQTPEGETAYILPTYTAMNQIRSLLAKQAKLENV